MTRKKFFLIRNAVADFETIGIYPSDKANMLVQMKVLDSENVNDDSIDLLDLQKETRTESHSLPELLIASQTLPTTNFNCSENLHEISVNTNENNKEKVTSE